MEGLESEDPMTSRFAPSELSTSVNSSPKMFFHFDLSRISTPPLGKAARVVLIIPLHLIHQTLRSGPTKIFFCPLAKRCSIKKVSAQVFLIQILNICFKSDVELLSSVRYTSSLMLLHLFSLRSFFFKGTYPLS